MTDAELELAILRRYVELHDATGTDAPKCARELEMKDVISSATGRPANDEVVKRWHARLAPRSPPYPKGVLRPCSDSTINSGPHQYHARAYYESGSAPAWERIAQLERQVCTKPPSEKEKEQKFGLLCSLRHASSDFASYCSGLTELHQWLLPTRTLQRPLFAKDGGTSEVDDDFAARGCLPAQ